MWYRDFVELTCRLGEESSHKIEMLKIIAASSVSSTTISSNYLTSHDISYLERADRADHYGELYKLEDYDDDLAAIVRRSNK